MTGKEIDKIISAEIPNKQLDPMGYEAVTSFMLHGPCGATNLLAPCMVDGKCKKFFPRQFQAHTTIDEDGFPIYRRRDTAATFTQNHIELDNRFVVPHNVDLVVRYQSHINVEICNRTRAVKYLFKYITKGPDRAKAIITTSGDGAVNEIKTYLDCRYLSAHEACWRLFKFPIHHRDPSVQRLLIHLPHEHNIYFSDKESIPGIINRPNVEKTMFTEWLSINQSSDCGRHLLYADFPTEWTWKKKEKMWKHRRSGYSIGRIIYVHPASGELYYMRLMLNEIRGARSYEDLRTVNGVLHDTYQSACFALGILGNDNEWLNALNQAAE